MMWDCEHARCSRTGRRRVWVDAGRLGSFWVWACEVHAAHYRSNPQSDPPLLQP